MAAGVEVTETYDITTTRGSHLLAALGFPGRMERAMGESLRRLADLAAGPRVSDDPSELL